jgi:hypothetical protein
MATLRTQENEERYKRLIAEGHLEAGCPLCASAPLHAFKHWKIIPNTFPYDKIATTHHMVVPLRHVRESELTPEELQELLAIKHEYINAHYEYILEATHKKKTIPAHFHLHLVVLKEL